jgi:hypothetical protein
MASQWGVGYATRLPNSRNGSGAWSLLSFGVTSEDYADPPQNITSCVVAESAISHRKRNSAKTAPLKQQLTELCSLSRAAHDPSHMIPRT